MEKPETPVFKHLLLQKGKEKEPPVPTTTTPDHLPSKTSRGPFQPQPSCNSVITEDKSGCSSMFGTEKKNPTNEKTCYFYSKSSWDNNLHFHLCILSMIVSRGNLHSTKEVLPECSYDSLSLCPLSHSAQLFFLLLEGNFRHPSLMPDLSVAVWIAALRGTYMLTIVITAFP